MKNFYMKSIKDSLRNIGCPVAHLIYKGDKTPYITYYSYRNQAEEFADDTAIVEGCFCTIEIHTKDDDTTLSEEVKNRLTANGWWITDETEDYDEDVDLYRFIIDVKYTKVG